MNSERLLDHRHNLIQLWLMLHMTEKQPDETIVVLNAQAYNDLRSKLDQMLNNVDVSAVARQQYSLGENNG